MQKEVEVNGKKYKCNVTHVLRDGTVLDSIKGHVVEVNESTEVFYRMLANLTDEDIARLEKRRDERLERERMESGS